MMLNVKQVAGELNFSEQQIYRWARTGAIRAIPFGRALRFDRGEVERVKTHGIAAGINLIGSVTVSGRSRIPSHQKKGAKLWE